MSQPLGRHATRLAEEAGYKTFVKIARDASDRIELQREASVYEMLRARLPLTARTAPRHAHWDADLGALALPLIRGSDLQRLVRRRGALPVSIAARLGEIVATLHDEGELLADDPPAPALSSGELDWHRPPLSRLRDVSGAGLDLMATLQRVPSLCQHLDRIAASTTRDTFIHGDLRLENVLVEEDTLNLPGLYLVDWECAGWGEAAWDVACLLAAALRAWISSIPDAPGVPLYRLADLAVVPLERLQPGIRAFLRAYEASRSSSSGPTTAVWRTRCSELVGARLVQLAFEATTGEEALHAGPVGCLQVAENLLTDPVRGAQDLLGVSA